MYKNDDICIKTESYIHRIGRTGRAGQTGVAHTLFGAFSGVFLKRFERVLKRVLYSKLMAKLMGLTDPSRDARYARALCRILKSADQVTS